MAVGGLDKINCPLGCVCVCVRAHGVLLWTDVSSRVFFCLFVCLLLFWLSKPQLTMLSGALNDTCHGSVIFQLYFVDALKLPKM